MQNTIEAGQLAGGMLEDEKQRRRETPPQDEKLAKKRQNRNSTKHNLGKKTASAPPPVMMTESSSSSDDEGLAEALALSLKPSPTKAGGDNLEANFTIAITFEYPDENDLWDDDDYQYYLRRYIATEHQYRNCDGHMTLSLNCTEHGRNRHPDKLTH